MWVGVLIAACGGASAARADVTGSFDGSLAWKQRALTPSAAASLSQVGKSVTGTVALPADLPTFGGAYLVTGTATSKRLAVSGAGPGGIFRWRAKIVGDTVQGRAKVKGPGGKLAGKLVATRNRSSSDGSGCDAVFAQNQSFFVDQVLGQALSTCTSCHQPGLQASATRLHVTPGDPLATARAVALFVDSTTPSASRILTKPLNLLPHGGGLPIVAGSTQEQILQQWVALVGQAHCN
jgi:hypothetical protein